MKQLKLIIGIIVLSVFLAGIAQAVPLSGQYEVSVVTTGSGTSWDFNYTVVVKEGAGPGTSQGLDGFTIQVPDNVTLSDIITPGGYNQDYPFNGYWVLQNPGNAASEAVLSNGYKWITWWGCGWPSVYPNGTSVNFGFHADGVVPGIKDAEIVTYWANGDIVHGWNTYTNYSTSLEGPTAPVPLPGAAWLFAPGILGLVGLKRKYLG
jgi:hypothetical protein